MAVQVMIIDGDVIAAHSYWTDDGSRIVTEATLRTADGQEVVVSQLGGSVGGLGMIQMPGPAILEPGMHVAVAAHSDVDLSQREHVVLDSAKVLAYPPGYVRTGPTKAGHSLYWESHDISVIVDSGGSAEVPGDLEFSVIDASIATWNNASGTCSDFKVTVAARKAMEVGNDKVNVIKLRDTVWGRPASGMDPARTYSPSAAGITTAIYVDDASSDRDGAIVDADVEINGVNFAISVDGQTSGAASCHAELQNTLTHELGHLHGLEHPCLAGSDPPRVDNLGNPVPSCGATSDPKILDATMYNFQDCGETKKETLSADDIQSICDIYPPKKAGGGCTSCNAPGGRGPSGVGLLLAAVVLGVLRRRKTSPSA